MGLLLGSPSRTHIAQLAAYPRISNAMEVHEGGHANGAGADQGETAEQDRLVLSVSEAAAALGISRAFAYELVAQNKLPALRLGRRIVIPRARFQEFLSNRLTGVIRRAT